MSLLNFEPSNPLRKGSKKPFKLILGIGALVGTIALGSTLAASINLNSGGPVEFGQGVTQTTACDDEITLTPYSSFINADGGGSFMGTRIVISGVDSSTEGCSGKNLKITGFTSSEPIAQIIVEVASASPWFTIDDVYDATLDDVSSSSFTIVIDPNILSIEASEVTRFTIESEDSVDVTPTSYEVGDRGPGGGIVFYVSTTNFTSTGSTCNTECKYLEVAPATWQSAGVNVADDSTYQWSTYTTVSTGQDKATEGTEGFHPDEKLNWKIGQGFYNTSVMVVDGTASAAQAAVLVYAGSASAGQWFIPSMNELNELCKYARGQTTGDPTVACDSSGTLKTGTTNDLGGFMGNVYWSSSEGNAVGGNPNNAWRQVFSGGYQDTSSVVGTSYVRPVRAF
jgi:hypothetical protein